MAIRRELRSFRGKRVLVTGGASGLGLELSKLFIADGARVLVTDLASNKPASVPPGADYLGLDVRSDSDWSRAREWVDSNWQGLDVVVNNAGIAVGGRIDRIGADEWERALDINLMGVVRGCTTFVPVLKRGGGGTIINTASLAAHVHGPAMATYNASKAAVLALSETLWAELKPFNIDVHVICPGFFKTNLAASLEGADEAMLRTATKLINNSKRDAKSVAAQAFSQIQRGRFVVLPDRDGKLVCAVKAYARPLYDRALLRAGERLALKK